MTVREHARQGGLAGVDGRRGGDRGPDRAVGHQSGRQRCARQGGRSFFDKTIGASQVTVTCEETFPSSSPRGRAHSGAELHVQGRRHGAVRGVFTYRVMTLACSPTCAATGTWTQSSSATRAKVINELLATAPEHHNRLPRPARPHLHSVPGGCAQDGDVGAARGQRVRPGDCRRVEGTRVRERRVPGREDPDLHRAGPAQDRGPVPPRPARRGQDEGIPDTSCAPRLR